MKISGCVLVLVLAVASAAFAGKKMTVQGATQEAILHDCRVTAVLSVELLKMMTKKTSPEKMLDAANKILETNNYKGSLGDADFVAKFYTGMALQSGQELKQMMAEVKEEDFDLMIEDHEVLCIKDAFNEGESGGEPGSMGGHGGMGGMSQ